MAAVAVARSGRRSSTAQAQKSDGVLSLLPDAAALLMKDRQSNHKSRDFEYHGIRKCVIILLLNTMVALLANQLVVLCKATS